MELGLVFDEWLPVLRREYLQSFVKDGGSAVKFLVPMGDMDRGIVISRLKTAAENEGYLFAAVDASSTRVDKIEQIFHAVAKVTPWDDLAYGFLRRVLKEREYILPEAQAAFQISQIAALNGLSAGQMRARANTVLRERLFRDYEMTQEFRVAMSRLCIGQLEPEEIDQGVILAVKDWLRGDLRLISPLRRALIFQKIGRHNGRHMLASLAHWLHLTGRTGLALTLDISRFAEAGRRKEGEESIHYTRAALLDGLEVLRQFVDGTDEACHAVIFVIAHPDFLHPEEKRGLWAYDALKLRIWDEVRDRQRTNPLAPLVRLSETRPTA
jgi:hypothetical protein